MSEAGGPAFLDELTRQAPISKNSLEKANHGRF